MTKTFRSCLPSIIITTTLIIYLLPILFTTQRVAGFPGDSSSLAAATDSFCQNFFKRQFHSTQFFYPDGINWNNGYDAALPLTLACSLQKFGPIVMFNFLSILQIGLILFTSYLLAHKFIKNPWLQLAFVFLYGFSGFTIARAAQHINILSTVWGINLCFYFFSDLDLTKFKRTLISCLSVAAACISAWQNFPNLFIPLIFLVGSAIYKSQNRLKALINLSVSALICSLLMYPFIQPIFSTYQQGNRIVDTQSMYVFNTDLISFFVPHQDHWSRPFFNSQVAEIERQKGPYFELIHPFDLGIILLLLYLIIKHSKSIWVQLKQHKLILLIMAVNIFLSFGPYIGLAGHDLIRLPYYDTLSKYPPFSMTRTPARMAIVSLCLGYLIIFQIIEKNSVSKSKSKNFFVYLFIYALFTTTIGAKNLTYPHLNIPKFYPLKGLAAIKNDADVNTVFNSPLELLNNPTQNFLQIYHTKPLVTGYVSYASLKPETQARIKTDPLLTSFGCVPHDQAQIDTVNQLASSSADLAQEFRNRQISYLIHYKMYPKDSRYPCPMAEYMINSIRQSNQLPIVDENENYVIFKIPTD